MSWVRNVRRAVWGVAVRRWHAGSRGWASLKATALAAGIATSAAIPVLAQPSFPDGTPVQTRPLVLSPTIRVTNVGWDDNVFRVSEAEGPIGDFTATVTPGVEVSLRLPVLSVSAYGELDFNHYWRLSGIRSIDTGDRVRVELLLGRVRPFVGGEYINARHNRGYEIDFPIRRLDWSWNTGVDLLLSGKSSIGVITRRSRVDYLGAAVYLDSDLAQYLGATTTIYGMRFRYSLTPLTTLGVEFEQDRSDFERAPERNSEGGRISSVVEFQPVAMVSGRAQIGVRRRTFLDGNEPPFTGMVARVDLGYTLLGRTRFAVAVQRDLSYSYRPDQRDYLQAGLELTITQRLGSAWDATGTLGRFNMTYGFATEGGTQAERVRNYGIDVGYHVGRTRVGLQWAQQTRASDFSVGRYYEGTRLGSSVSYTF